MRNIWHINKFWALVTKSKLGHNRFCRLHSVWYVLSREWPQNTTLLIAKFGKGCTREVLPTFLYGHTLKTSTCHIDKPVFTPLPYPYSHVSVHYLISLMGMAAVLTGCSVALSFPYTTSTNIHQQNVTISMSTFLHIIHQPQQLLKTFFVFIWQHKHISFPTTNTQIPLYLN